MHYLTPAVVKIVDACGLQAHGLDRDLLQRREVVKIDIANDPVDRRVSINLFIVLIITNTDLNVHAGLFVWNCTKVNSRLVSWTQYKV